MNPIADMLSIANETIEMQRLRGKRLETQLSEAIIILHQWAADPTQRDLKAALAAIYDARKRGEEYYADEPTFAASALAVFDAYKAGGCSVCEIELVDEEIEKGICEDCEEEKAIDGTP